MKINVTKNTTKLKQMFHFRYQMFLVIFIIYSKKKYWKQMQETKNYKKIIL